MNATTTQGTGKGRLLGVLAALLVVFLGWAAWGPDTRAEPRPDPGAAVPWDAYVPSLRAEVDGASCLELRDAFDNAVWTNDATLRRTGYEHGNDRLLAYIAHRQDVTGCRP